MNILITGAAGALGRNLVENLKAIRDGKNRTRPELKIEEIYEYDKENIGINITAKIADNNTPIYQKMLEAGDVKDIPVELYTVDYHYFSGATVNKEAGIFQIS